MSVSAAAPQLCKTNNSKCQILLSNGAFCTPRSVIRSITSRKKPTTQEVVTEMAILEEEGIGKFEGSSKEKVFFKPLPVEGVNLVHVKFQEYKDCFLLPIDNKYINTAQ